MFDHEKLRVYQEALAFASWSEGVLDRAKKSSSLYDLLDRARTSILFNIAEGHGRCTPPDRWRFFDTARGSALECAAGLDLFAIKKGIEQKELQQGRATLQKIVSMLAGLIRSNSTDRLHETPVSCRETAKRDYD